MRKPFQGVYNIIRFNWHFFAMALALMLVTSLLTFSDHRTLSLLSGIVCLAVGLSVMVSLYTSYYIYDYSSLYTLDWLNFEEKNGTINIVNIHAGFDESSELIRSKFPNSELHVFDFYDPEKHTEVSIKRARKAYPPYQNTIAIKTNHIPLNDENVDVGFAILSAHEIRKSDERIAFFKELARIIKPDGQIIITEHLRDLPNFLAYNIGFFHFHSRSTWSETFMKSELSITDEFKITPFLTTFILKKNGTTH